MKNIYRSDKCPFFIPRETCCGVSSEMYYVRTAKTNAIDIQIYINFVCLCCCCLPYINASIDFSLCVLFSNQQILLCNV
jgi:hypothetical protein